MAGLVQAESLVKLPELSIFPKNPKLPLWLLRLVSVTPFTGLLGLDHILVGSSTTGAIKAMVPPSGYLLGSGLTGLLGAGGLPAQIIGAIAGCAWYLYDVAYVTNNKRVIENGFEIPFIGGGQFGKGRVSEKVMGGMERFVGLISGALLAIVMLAGAGIAFYFEGSTTGQTKNILSVVKYIAGAIGVLMAARTYFAITQKDGGSAAPLPPLGAAAAGAATAGAAAAAAPSANNLIKAAISKVTEPATEAATEATTEAPTQSGGGSLALTLSAIAAEVIKKKDAEAFPTEELAFFGILAAITVAGIAFAVYRYKQKVKADKNVDAGDAGTIRGAVGAPTGV
jgi:hypothetical protein